MGRVVLAVLDHRDRHRDLAWSAPAAACRPRSRAGRAVHRLRRPGPARLRRSPASSAALLAPLAEAEISVFTHLDLRHRLDPGPAAPTPSAPPRPGDDAGHTVVAAVPVDARPEGQDDMSVTTPRRLPRRRRRRRPEVAPAPRTSRWSSTTARTYDSATRVHRQPLQGQPGAVEPGGRQGRHRPRRRPQLRRRQLLHRPRGLPDHPRGRRAGRRRTSASARSTWSSAPPA